MGIRDFLDRLRMKKAKYKDYADEMKIQETYEERKKSANERELERYVDEAREEEIKVELEKWRKMKKKEVEFGHQILNTKNMFENEKPTMLRQKRIFVKHNPVKNKAVNQRGGLFFK